MIDKKDNTENIMKEFHRISGEILRKGVHVETTLEFFIENYFSYPQNNRTFLLGDWIINKMGFLKKQELFGKICKEENVYDNYVKEIYAAITFVRDARDRVAHWEAHILNPKDQTITLLPKRSSYSIKEGFEPNGKTLNEVEEKRLFAITGINKKHVEILKKLQIESSSQ